MFIASLEHPTGRVVSLAPINGFFIPGALLVVREIRLAPEMSITFSAGDSDIGEGARTPSHTIATRLVSDVFGITCARFVTRFIHKIRHRGR